MYYNLSRKDLKIKNGTDFKEKDIINVNNIYEIEISYGKEKYDRPSMCSKVFDLRTMKYQDIVFRPDYITYFLHR